ncbi:NADPH-flavin oxidoreductase [Anaerohalosphaera lusitana]|uniref:NADPH-flavin oxidoreductase n=1 Tax=Anaerohalosphaera lusitana TaxID=1936003 RepID=A0A1U9NIE7_9BACT|nr:nitroreductase family protein [Anaerohalosphaera lusitana]AQT67286.1 NADPH-flavin oxidoreductase [Anaerohalosphaera lusitana]
MNLFEVIKKRHSYRGAFTDQTVPREDLQKIVDAGLKAPSGCNAQTVQFVIVDDPETLGKIGQMHEKNLAIQQAKAMIVCVVDRDPKPVFEDLSFEVEDCAAAVQNMLLAITDLGYASVWIDGWLRREQRAEKIGELLGIPEDKVVRIVLPIGVPVEEKSQPDKKPFEQRAWFNQYGGTA